MQKVLKYELNVTLKCLETQKYLTFSKITFYCYVNFILFTM